MFGSILGLVTDVAKIVVAPVAVVASVVAVPVKVVADVAMDVVDGVNSVTKG